MCGITHWFAFLQIGFPDITWRVRDSKTGLITDVQRNVRHKPYAKSCSGILVTLKYVLTADHCMWLLKPVNMAFPGDEASFQDFVSLA